MKNRHEVIRFAAGLLGLALLVAVVFAGATSVRADASVFINEIHYDNTGTDAGEAIEIAGPAGTDLTGWSLVLYNGSNGAVYNTNVLSGILPDQDNGFGTLSFDYPVNGIQNGSPDGMALVDPANNVIQFLSYEGTFTAVGGPADGLTSTDIGVSETGSEAIGLSLQLTGTGITYDQFTWAAPAANTMGSVNTGQIFSAVANAPVLAACGGSLTTYEGGTSSKTVSASDADGIVVDIAVTTVNPSPTSGTTAITDLVPAAEVGGTAEATITIDALAPAGNYAVTVTATNDDPTAQTGTCTFNVTVLEVLPIGVVQGVVADTDNGTRHASPYVGQTVAIQGVIYQKLLARTSSGGSTYGFHIQNTADTADGDPNSSDGIFVFMSGFTDLIGGYVPQVGDEVVISGRVSEFFNLTELSSARGLAVLRSGVDLDAELPAEEVNPPTDIGDANRYWERREGMRVQVPEGSIVMNGRDVFASTLDGEVWVIRDDAEVAQRVEPYARRVFRDPHPLDDIPDVLFDNDNGYRIIMGSLGLKGAANNNTALIAPSRTFDTMNNSPIGGVYFSFSKYQIQIEQQLDLGHGVDPAENAPPQDFDRTFEYSMANFNVENLYDYRDDPFDGCDFTGNPGCPGVSPPFDYVPASDEAYQTRLNEIAMQVIGDLHSPEFILVQEAEDQDICTVSAGSFECDFTANNADGRPDTLQELAVVIHDLGGPWYEAAYDRDGADDRGIVSGFLYRTDRVELLPASMTDPVLGDDPQVVYRGDPLAYNTDVQNPKVLNAVLPDDVDRSTGTDGDLVFTRAPQIGLFRMWRDGIGSSVFTDMYLISNHFSSTPNARVGQRTEQAAYNAAIVDTLQATDPGVFSVVGGDLNVYPRPDDPFPPPDTSDQLGPLYNQGMSNLWDVVVSEVPASAYTYVFQGQAQTLDQMFVVPAAFDELVQVRIAHINSDWPADYVGDGPRGTSDHDPQVARYSLLPTIARLKSLVEYYNATGQISSNRIATILINRLDLANLYWQEGKLRAYDAQLQAFINQVLGFAPVQIDQVAADALAHEAMLLRELP